MRRSREYEKHAARVARDLRPVFDDDPDDFPPLSYWLKCAALLAALGLLVWVCMVAGCPGVAP